MFHGNPPSRRLVIIAFTVLCLLLVWTTAFAGAWGQERGKYFFSLQTYYYESSKYFDDSGQRKNRGGTFQKWEINPYLEWGMTEKNTLSLNAFYDWLSDDVSGHAKRTCGFADLELGWQYRFLERQSQVFSIQGIVIVPTGYDVTDDPRLGYDRWGMELGILFGTFFRFLGNDGFVDAVLSYRRYFGYPSSQFRPRVTVGWDVLKKLQAFMEGKLEYGLKDGSPRNLGRNLVAQPNYRLLKTTIGLNYRISQNTSILFAIYRHAWGEMTGGGGGGYVSLWFRF